ncbi:hypothetical protein F5146DRAFT_1125226 [Armillaria mellea]|nr:hypothetical protein F5146DRAFT_1125226 [Armillaria mellea]
MFKQALALLPLYFIFCAAAPSPGIDARDTAATCALPAHIWCCSKLSFVYNSYVGTWLRALRQLRHSSLLHWAVLQRRIKKAVTVVLCIQPKKVILQISLGAFFLLQKAFAEDAKKPSILRPHLLPSPHSTTTRAQETLGPMNNKLAESSQV